MVFSCVVPDIWNLIIFDLLTILVLLPPTPCHFICTPHNSPFWDLCTLASDLPCTAVAYTTKSNEMRLGCMKNFVTRSSSCGRFRALVSHRGDVIGTRSRRSLFPASFNSSIFRAPPARTATLPVITNSSEAVRSLSLYLYTTQLPILGSVHIGLGSATHCGGPYHQVSKRL